MQSSKQEIIINHAAIDLYNIVLDVEKYPDFIPWCDKIIITSKSKNNILADMKVKYYLFSTQTFTSKVCFDSKKLLINTNYIKGPLNDLKTKWKFISLENHKRKVKFTIAF